MTKLHAPSRRELLLASGTLFAWAYLPKLARAEGRDPRFLTIVLRGALDGLATVAPVGDPDWVSLRGDNALTLDGKIPALKLDDFFALNPAMPNLRRMFKANEAIVVHAAATPYRALAFRRPGRARKRSRKTGRDLHRLAQPFAHGACARRPGQCERRQGFRGRTGDAVGRAWTSAGAVMGAAEGSAGERRQDRAIDRSLSTHRRQLRPRP